MSATRHCPALLIAAPASGQGKTTVTAALAQHWRAQGLRVRIFKTGPDFIDPMILARASGQPVYQLDLWLGGQAHCQQLLYTAAGAADLILIEGVMGLFDGQPASADLAIAFDIPVLAVIDASAMAQTFGAIALGLARYRPQLTCAGVFANRVAGATHARMLDDSLPPGLRSLGHLPRQAMSLPERHLGLVQAEEIDDLDERLTQLAASLQWTDDRLPAPVAFAHAPTPALPARLAGVRIAVARDAAFSFIHAANLDLLRALGAELYFFSPLTDTLLPPADALWLPGGYPELHRPTLARNQAMQAAIRAYHAAGKPILAECGGMLYLLESLAGPADDPMPMLGLMPGHARLQTQLAALGPQSIQLPAGELRGHTFHYSQLQTPLAPWQHARPARGDRPGEAVYRIGRLFASYLHLYFPSNPEATAELFRP